MANRGTSSDSDAQASPNPEQEPVNTFVRGGGETTNVDRPSSLAFHQFCSIFPTEKFYRDERADGNVFIMPQGVRPFIRYWPLTMLVMTGLYLLIPVFEPGIDPVWTFFPQVTSDHIPWIVGTLITWGILLEAISRVGIIDGYGKLFKPAIVYGLFGILLAGVGFSVFLVWQSDSPANIPANIVFGSGFLFAAYISGFIAYDLLIRTENMLENFGEKNIVPDKKNYNSVFLKEFKSDLQESFLGVPLAYIFGIVFTLQLVGFWYLQNGPHQLNSTIALICNAFFDAILMTAVFQFLIFIRELNLLFEDEYENDNNSVELKFQPFHPDGRGGFRDVGRAAMQVNVLVIIAGLYYVYRLFVQGSRALPEGGFPALEGTTAVVWLVDFVGPIVLYGVVSMIWLYYTFWTAHLKMARDKEKMILQQQSSKRKENNLEITEPIGTINDREGYEELLTSPEWPLDSRQIQTVVLSNIIPVFLTLTSLPI